MKKGSQRLDKILSHLGYGTRSELRKLTKQGAVTVNGTIVKDSSAHVLPGQDVIAVHGKPIRYREHIYLMMNKPPGVISSTDDPREKTVLDLLRPEDAAFTPFPVGRLDKDTEGLLILSNDGQMAHLMLSPKKHVNKTYYAEVTGCVDETDQQAMRAGVTLDDGYVTMPAELRILEAGQEQSKIELTIQEGKFHQVKRMFLAVGKKVTYLKRIRMGVMELDPDLKLGEYRELTEAEAASLLGKES